MFEDIIVQGKTRGFLKFPASLENQHVLFSRWEEECVKLKIPAIYIIDLEDGTARVIVEILEGLRITPTAHSQVEQILERCETWGGVEAREIRFVGPADKVEEPVLAILKICEEDSSEERQQEALESIKRPFEGLARCVDNTGIEDKLTVGEVVFLREIPNQIDHCLVLKSGMHPLVSIDIHRFELPFHYQSF